MTEIEKLCAIEEIKQLKARYWYYTDTKDWEAFAGVFAPGFEFDHSTSFQANDPVSGASHIYGKPELLAAIDTSGWKIRGHEQLAAMAGSFAATSTVHQGYNPQITIHSVDTASGIWAMQDMLGFGSETPIKEIRGYGHYHETYRKIDGQWLIASCKLTRLRVDVW